MIEQKEVVIYEIKGRKVGQSRELEKRMAKILQPDEEYRILQVIPPNTLTLREVWETECDWQLRLGYPVEEEFNFKFLENTMNGSMIDLIHERARLTRNSIEWQSGKGIQWKQAIISTMNDSEWKATIGTAKRLKQSQTINDSEWKATIGQNKVVKQSQNLSRTLNDPAWKATTGARKSARMKETLNDPLWKDTSGKIKSQRQSTGIRKKLNDPQWKQDNYVICPYCGKGPFHKGVANRWHFDNCKSLHLKTQ